MKKPTMVKKSKDAYLVTWQFKNTKVYEELPHKDIFFSYLEAQNHILGLMGSEGDIPLNKLEMKVVKSYSYTQKKG